MKVYTFYHTLKNFNSYAYDLLCGQGIGEFNNPIDQ